MDTVSSSFHLRGTHLYIMLDDVFFRGNNGLVQGLYALRNQRVETVFVKGAMSTTTGRIPDHVYQPIFEALGGLLEHVERLEVSGDGRFGGLHLPVRAMITALQNHEKRPEKLRSLRLGNVILSQQGEGDTDMAEFAAALQQLPLLRSIDLVRCRAEQEIASLEPLIHVMCTIPTLQEVMMCETVVSSAFLAELCRSPSLIKIWWKTMPGLSDDHIASMADVLREANGDKSHLKELTIRSHGLGRKAGQAIANMLLTNTTLQVINLDLDRPDFGLPLAHALHTNQTLKCLDVWVWNSAGNTNENENDNDDGNSNATTISSLTITKAFTTMLQHNYVLQFLTFQGLDWTNPEVDFYLRLNRAGRVELLQKFTDRRKWTEALILRREDISVVFYFLTLNPFIICAQNGDSNNDEVRVADCLKTLNVELSIIKPQPTNSMTNENAKRNCFDHTTHVERSKRYKT